MQNKLDHIDRKILATLQAQARLSNLSLAEAVALSPSACLARVQRLRDAGYIVRDLALMDLSKLGSALHALLEITLTNHSINEFLAFEKALEEFEEITMAVKVSGRFDYLLAVTVTDMPRLNQLSDILLDGSLPIAKLVTIPILDVTKNFGGFPINRLCRIKFGT